MKLVTKKWTHKIPTRKILNPQNTHEEKFWTHELPAGKNFEPRKYQQEKVLDPQRHNDMTARDRQNLAYSVISDFVYA